MVVKMAGLGRSFGGVADYCLHDRCVPGESHPESAERVEWTETRNLATGQGERAARIMAATAEAGPELKRLAGVAATGRKLEKPVCHYSLSWAKDEKPNRPEMRRAALDSLKALGLEEHQALIVSHRDGQPHVHVIREPGGPGERQGGGVEPEPAAPLEVGGRVRAGSGSDPMPEAGQEQRATGTREAGCGWARAFGGPLAAGADESAAGAAGSDTGGTGRARRRGAAAGAAGERLSEGVGSLTAVAGAGRRTARDRRGDSWTHVSTGALSGGVGGSATAGAGGVGESAFGSGAGDRGQGGRNLQQRHGRIEGTGGEGCEDERRFRVVHPSYRSASAQAGGRGGADGAGPGDRGRAGLREDEAGRGEGQPTGGAFLTRSVA